jgi:fatty acid desaturase
MSALFPGDLQRRSDAASAAVLALQIVGSLAPVFAAAALSPGLATFVCWLVAGSALNALTNLLHEASHGLVFRDGTRSQALGRWILGPLLLADFDSYTRRHWEHHRWLGEPTDPKLAYRVPVRGSALATLALRCLAGIEATSRYRVQASAASGSRASKAWLARTALVQALLFAALSGVAYGMAGGDTRTALLRAGVAWAVVYLYGLVAVTVLLATLRAVAEHQPEARGGGETRQGEAVLRNFRCNGLTRLVFGAYGFGEHFTHHRYPQVPYYRLLGLTARLAAQDDALAPRAGYVETLRRIRS